MSKLFKNYINGKWKASASGETFENVNPANHSEVLGRFQKSNKKDVNEAIALPPRHSPNGAPLPLPSAGKFCLKWRNCSCNKKNRWRRT